MGHETRRERVGFEGDAPGGTLLAEPNVEARFDGAM
jgi:hypothetical protein